ncbi:MAG: hypothetical protein M3N43_06490 [Actinomycetota bacterium]|nr:hypothetical protein [Actinomycetota bacterium]
MGIYGTGLYGTAVYGEDPAQFGVSDLRVDLFLTVGNGKVWSPVVDDVRRDIGVSLSRGRSGESQTASPARCSLTFDNRDGKYSPRNTAGTLYGLIGRNTPIRVGMGNPCLGSANTGTTDAIVSSQIVTLYGAVGVMAAAFVTPNGDLTSPTGYSAGTEQDTTAWTMRHARTTDTGVVPAATWTHSGAQTLWAAGHVAVPGGVADVASNSMADSGGDPSNIAFSAAQAERVVTAICFWSSDPDDRMPAPFVDDQRDTHELYLVSDTGPSTGPRCMVWAWWQKAGSDGNLGLRNAQDGATVAGISVTWWTGADRYSPRFCGEVAEWPVEWDPTLNQIITPVQAGGVLRRLSQSTDVVSPLSRALSTGTEIIGYWPMEDPAGSTQFAPAVGGTPGVFINTVSPGQVDTVAGSLPLPDFTGGGMVATVPGSVGTAFGGGCVVAIPANGLTAGTNLLTLRLGGGASTIVAYTVEYSGPTTLTEKITYSDTTTATYGPYAITAVLPGGMLGRQIMLYIGMYQDGADVKTRVTINNITPNEASVGALVSNTWTTETLGVLGQIALGVEGTGTSTLGINGLGMGHAFATRGYVLNQHDRKAEAARGWAKTDNTLAARNTAYDYRVRFNGVRLAAWDTLNVGAVEPAPVVEALSAIEAAGQAVMADAAGFVGIEWRPLSSMVTSVPKLNIDYQAGIFVPGSLAPLDDDSILVNDQTVVSTLGDSGRYQATTGSYSVLNVGRYSKSDTLPVDGPAAALDLASWLVAQGTVDAARWPEFTLRMARDTTPFDLRELSIGDTITLTNLPSLAGVTTVDLIVTGFVEEIDSAQWTLGIVTRLAAPYSVLIWDQGDWSEHVWGL